MRLFEMALQLTLLIYSLPAIDADDTPRPGNVRMMLSYSFESQGKIYGIHRGLLVDYR
jgi:hypothetical protein